jgi:hypothetical protein
MKTRALALLLSTALLALWPAIPVHADEYTIHNCPASLQPNFDAGPWQPWGEPLASPSGYQASCTPGSTLGTAIGWYGAAQNFNTNTGVVLQTPSAALTVREMRLVWTASHQSSGSDTWAQITSGTGVELVAATPYSGSATDLGDLTKAQYVMRRQAVQDEIERLAPPADPQLSEAEQVLADFSSFWEREHAPAERHCLLATLFEQVWQDDGRVVAIKPQPAFAAYFQAYCQPLSTMRCQERERRDSNPRPLP